MGSRVLSVKAWPMRNRASGREMDMEVRYLGLAVVAALIAFTVFFSVSLEGQAGEQMTPHHLYALQYSYDGEIWHELITIEDNALSENKRYLRQNGRFPCLRYAHSYLDEDGTQRLDYIPLTVGGIPRVNVAMHGSRQAGSLE